MAATRLTLRDHLKPNLIVSLMAHGDSIEAITWSEEKSLLVTGSRDGTTQRGNGGSFDKLLALKSDGGSITDLRISADGRTLVVLVQGEQAARIRHLDRLHARFENLKIAW